MSSATKNPRPEQSIVARGVSFTFGRGETRTQVLFDNNLSIGPGELVIMTGPSGSGKTTLLTLIGALRKMQEGTLNVLGHAMENMDAPRQVALRKEIGFIFQQHNLFSSLSALENVRMATSLKPARNGVARRPAIDLLARLGLGERLHHPPANLSGGQRQRVAIARALVNRPRLVLADEPTAALDAASGEVVMDLLGELAREDGSTILLVTHDKRLIERATRIVNMVQGRIISNVVTGDSIRIGEALARSSVFSTLSASALARVVDRMRRESYPAGTTIIRQGETGERFYVIGEGTVEIIADGKRRAELGEGDFFGEIALMSDAPRNATVKSKTDVELFTLGKADFQEVLAASDNLAQRLRMALMDRQ